ncbi:MAG: sugar phosphate isomerase/epimerase [Acidimicrobiales bacterium]
MNLHLELCWGTARGAALPDLISVASEAGFTTVTASPILFFDAVRDGFSGSELRARMSDAGVRVTVVDPLTHGLPGVPELGDLSPQLRAFAIYSEEDCFYAAQELGASTVNVAHFLAGPQPYGAMLDHLGSLTSRAAERGLDVSLEFIPGTGIGDIHMANDLCRDISASNLGITFDSWHFHRSGGFDEDQEQLRPALKYVKVVQLSDAVGETPAGGYVPMRDRLLPGEGDLPLSELVSTLTAVHPGIRLGLEIFQAKMRRRSPLAAAISARDSIIAALTDSATG